MGSCCVPVCESERRMPKPEYEFHAPSAPWLPAGGKVTGIWQQVLANDPATKSYTGLTRYEPGTDTSPNGPAVHDYWEEVFILEGDLTDLHLGQTFRQGMYACRPPGMVHGPWRTETGVLMLEIRYASVLPAP
jgi:ChrR-like protein with cupin domain